MSDIREHVYETVEQVLNRNRKAMTTPEEVKQQIRDDARVSNAPQWFVYQVYAAIDSMAAELAEAKKDAGRYRRVRDLACNQLYLTRDGDHACNYMTAKDWIEANHHEYFSDVPPDELQRMKDTNTIWQLQIYPNTPVGSNVWHGATLDSVVDAALTPQEQAAK